MEPETRPAFRIALIYALAAALWILLSDRLVEVLFTNPHTATLLQTYKGWGFVAVSAALMYWLLRREMTYRERALRLWANVYQASKLGTAVISPRECQEMGSPRLGESCRLTLVNLAFAEMFNAPIETLTGQPLEHFFAPEAELEHHLEAAEAAGHYVFEASLVRRSGRRFPASVDVTVVKDAQGQTLNIIIAIQDITERRRSDERIQRQLQRLAGLRAIDIAITGTLDRRVTFNTLLDQVTAQLNLDAAAVLEYDPVEQKVDYAASRGFHSTEIQNSSLRVGQGLAGKVAKEMKLISVPNLPAERHLVARHHLMLEEESFIAYFGVPLLAKGELRGVLEVFQRTPLEVDQEWLDFLEALAGQAAIAIDNANLYENLQRYGRELAHAYDATLEGWSHALELRDHETQGHSQRVTEMTLQLAEEMGIPDGERRYVRWGTLLHDIGKMGVPDHILLKPGPLTPEEWEVMRRHPVYAYEMLAPIQFLRPALDIPYSHHERWDGSGYPRGLKGEQIPLAARIFSVVDVWDALRSQRPYRGAWDEARVQRYLRERAGTQFDPVVVQNFLSMLGNGKMN